MTILVVGASGATGRLLVKELLDRGHKVRAMVRSPDRLPDDFRNHDNLSIIPASVLDLSDAGMTRHVTGCKAVASCLGHTLSLKGLYGQPRRLVTDTVQRLCGAIRNSKPDQPVRFVLMNTVANRNRDLSEPIPLAQKCVVWLLRLLLPPHADNENAAEYLRVQVGQHDETIEWAAVRPDTLRDAGAVTDYEVHPSPTRSAIFNAGTTSRVNVAHFMADLITDPDTWTRWKGQMPAVYNRE